MNGFSKLLVNWKSPNNENFPVATLELLEGKYHFKYNKRVVEEAENDGFSPFVGLSNVDQTYSSDKLFSIFDRRIPNKERNVFKKFMEDHDLDTSKHIEWSYLAITKGTLATDSISFIVPAVYFNEKETLYLGCEIAGWSYTRETVGDLDLKNKIAVVSEEENKFDAEAISLALIERNNLKLGYIPKPYNQLFYRVLKENIPVFSTIYSITREGRPLILIAASVPRKFIANQLKLQYMIEYK